MSALELAIPLPEQDIWGVTGLNPEQCEYLVDSPDPDLEKLRKDVQELLNLVRRNIQDAGVTPDEGTPQQMETPSPADSIMSDPQQFSPPDVDEVPEIDCSKEKEKPSLWNHVFAGTRNALKSFLARIRPSKEQEKKSRKDQFQLKIQSLLGSALREEVLQNMTFGKAAAYLRELYGSVTERTFRLAVSRVSEDTPLSQISEDFLLNRGLGDLLQEPVRKFSKMDFARVMQNIEPEYAVPQKTPFAKVKEQETAFQFPEKKISEPYQIPVTTEGETLEQFAKEHFGDARKSLSAIMTENMLLNPNANPNDWLPGGTLVNIPRFVPNYNS